MGAEAFMPGIKQRKLQRIDDSACCVNDTSGQEPEESGSTKCIQQPSEDKHTYPSHGNIDDGRKPFGAGNPTGFHQHARDGDAPDQSQQGVAHVASQHDQAYRRVGAGDEHEDHHMVQLAEDAQIPPGQIHRVVSGAGAVEQYHAGHEDGHGDEMLPS